MKVPSAHLFQLIAGLSLSERRYCSLYLKKHGNSGNRYVALFNRLCKADTYDSAQVMAALGYSKKPGHYAVLKKQLYEQLLDALYLYHLFTNPEQQLMQHIQQCRLLLQKGLIEQCDKRVKQLLPKAAALHHYEAQLQLQQLQLALKARRYYRHEKPAALDEWQQQTLHILNQYQTTVNYRYLSSKVYRLQYQAGARGKQLAEQMKAILQLPQFTQPKHATTLPAQLDFLQVRALYHFTNGETTKASEYNRRFIALLEESPVLMQTHADRYFSVLNNLLIDSLVLRQHSLMLEGLQKLRSLQKIPAFKRLANFDVNVFRLGYLLELNYCIATGNFVKAESLIKPVSTGLTAYGTKVVKHNRITLHYLMAYTCFALGQYNRALDFLFPILQEKEAEVALQLQTAARMLQLLCHFEKGDMLLADSLVKTLRRLLPAANQANALPRLALSLIAAGIKSPGQLNWPVWEKKAQTLARKKQSADALNLFNYWVWIRAHRQGTLFAHAWQNA